jgi:hypothetical protein
MRLLRETRDLAKRIELENEQILADIEAMNRRLGQLTAPRRGRPSEQLKRATVPLPKDLNDRPGGPPRVRG